MKISYKWLKEFIETDHSPEKVAEILTQTGLEVEGLEILRFDDLVRGFRQIHFLNLILSNQELVVKICGNGLGMGLQDTYSQHPGTSCPGIAIGTARFGCDCAFLCLN